MLNKRIVALLMTIMMLCLLTPAVAENEDNLLFNGSFELVDDDGMPQGWYTEAYIKDDGYTAYGISDDAYEGEQCVAINNFGLNDARFAQTVDVIPSSLYCLSGWIKVDSMLDSGRGANLSIENLYVFSESIFDVDDEWHFVEMYGETGEDQYEVTVFARVGGYSGESQGKAYFDSISLREVEAVPAGYQAVAWYRDQQPVAVAPVEEETAVAEAQPFWPWLLLISVAYLVFAAWVSTRVMQDQRDLNEPRHASVLLWIGLAVAAAARIAVAVLVEGYQVDVNCFRSWGHTFTTFGPTMFYQSTSFCDYTPAYIYVMGLSDWLDKLGNALGLQVMEAFYHKLVPMACDLIGAYLIYRFARKERFSRIQAEALALLVAFNPAMFINSAAWCQIDSVLCLGLLIVAWLAVQRKWSALLPVYVLCALIKPQALMLGPLGLLVIVLDWIKHPKEDTKPMLVGLGLSALVAAAIVIPFSIHQQPGWLIEKYTTTLASYPYATVNTANFYYLFGANWAGIEQSAHWLASLCLAIACIGWGIVLYLRRKDQKLWWLEPALMAIFAAAYLVMTLLGCSWAVLGYATMGLAFAVVLPMYIRSGNVRHVPLLGAVLFIILYVLGIKMHERYLFPALLLLALAMALHRDKRILGLLAVLSCTMLINEGIVLDNSLRLGSSMGHLNNDTHFLNMLISFINVACVGWAVWTAYTVCVEHAEQRIGQHARPLLPVKHYEKKPCHALNYATDHKLHWRPIDWILMLAVTAVYSVVCLCNLGSTKAPQNAWTSTAYNEAVVVDLGQRYDHFSMLYFCRVSHYDFSVAVSDDGENWSGEHWAEMAQGQCYRWKYLAPSWEKDDGTRAYYSVSDYDDVQRLSGRYVRITAQQINLVLNEVIFRDSQNQSITTAKVIDQINANVESANYSDPANILDEQDTLDGEPSWYNSTYFDEIYHARTAYEHLHGMAPYETSHPPLGKVIMSWFVGIFGMTPFGWRFAGALAGILMLPAMYVLGKQLTKRTDMAFVAMTLMSLDCMHFTQTRIATIDSFPVLFIILSYLFMARFMQRDIVLQPMKKVLPDLALSGFFMGCSVASKWIGAYAGIGLAVLYFWTCVRHLRLANEANILLADGYHGDDVEKRTHGAWRRVIYLCLWCLLFFIAVPLLIYLLSYIPHFAYAKKSGLMDFLELVWNANFAPQYGMLDYHSTPGLGMDHPFYSPWYEWLLITRPMYYAMGQFAPQGYDFSIFCFGNPAVWLVGLAGLAFTLWLWGKRHMYTLEESNRWIHLQGTSWSIVPAFVMIGFLAQFLPWVLVPRGTYIYHYFASVPFLILSIMLLLNWLRDHWPRTARIILIAYLVVCLIFFVAYYPYASGVVTPTWWLDFMKQFLKVYYI